MFALGVRGGLNANGLDSSNLFDSFRFIYNTEVSAEMTHLSLFTGIGGIDLAAEWAGFETVGQCEWADYPTKVLEKHWPDVPRWKDIRTLTKEDFNATTGLHTVDLISGGFPCQPFSVVGRKKRKSDERYLFPEMLRIIQELQPKWVLGENVAGIDDGSLDTICASLEKENYEITGIFEIPACLFGAPHERYRVFIVANSTSQSGIQANSPIMSTGSNRKSRNSNLRKVRAFIPGTYWAVYKSPIFGMADGLPYGMDEHKARCTTLGNAVVPQQVYPILRAIAKIIKGGICNE